MTTYKVMAKTAWQKRFHAVYPASTDPKAADRRAIATAAADCYRSVKVIVTDDNGITNTLIYK